MTPFPQPFLPRESQADTAQEQEPGTVQSSQDVPFLADDSSQSPLGMHKVQTAPCPALFLLPRFPSSSVEAIQSELRELWFSGPELQLPVGSVLPPRVTVQDSHVPSPSPGVIVS